MDFFQFLSKSSEEKSNTVPEIQKSNQTSHSQLETTLYKSLKVGDFIKIVFSQNSNLNVYKGYIGEIKEYKQDQTHALIFLHGISAPTIIKFPLYHFIKFNTNKN